MTSYEEGAPLPLRATMGAWIDGRRARSEIADNTYRASRYHIAKFAEHFGDDADLRQLTPANVEAWLELLTVKPQSRNTICATLRQFFRWAVRRELLDRDPFADINNAKVERRLPRIIPETQVEEIVSNADLDLRSRVMVTVAAGTGMRRAEIAALRVEDWDRSGHTLLVRGKGSKQRVIAIDGEVDAALEVWLRDGRTNGPMWPSPRGGGKRGLHVNRVGAIITEASNRLGLHWTPHTYRHTMASNLLLDGAPIVVVRDRLGHESIDTTNIYSHAEVDDQRPWLGRRYFKGRWGEPLQSGLAG
jgi:site-specific recombinase XerD